MRLSVILAVLGASAGIANTLHDPAGPSEADALKARGGPPDCGEGCEPAYGPGPKTGPRGIDDLELEARGGPECPPGCKPKPPPPSCPPGCKPKGGYGGPGPRSLGDEAVDLEARGGPEQQCPWGCEPDRPPPPPPPQCPRGCKPKGGPYGPRSLEEVDQELTARGGEPYCPPGCEPDRPPPPQCPRGCKPKWGGGPYGPRSLSGGDSEAVDLEARGGPYCPPGCEPDHPPPPPPPQCPRGCKPKWRPGPRSVDDEDDFDDEETGDLEARGGRPYCPPGCEPKYPDRHSCRWGEKEACCSGGAYSVCVLNQDFCFGKSYCCRTDKNWGLINVRRSRCYPN